MQTLIPDQPYVNFVRSSNKSHVGQSSFHENRWITNKYDIFMTSWNRQNWSCAKYVLLGMSGSDNPFLLILFILPAVAETTERTLLSLEKLQHSLTDTLQSLPYIYCQTDNLMLTFSSALLWSHSLSLYKLPYSLKRSNVTKNFPGNNTEADSALHIGHQTLLILPNNRHLVLFFISEKKF